MIEPLHLVFRLPVKAWRHIYADGGTTEGFYPPTAYRTHEQTRAQLIHRTVEQPVLIESHPLGRSSNKNLPLLISLVSTAADAKGSSAGWSGLPAGICATIRWMRGGAACRWASRSTACSSTLARSLTLPAGPPGVLQGRTGAGTNALRRYLYEHVCARYHGELMIPRANYSTWFGIGNHIHTRPADRPGQAGRRAGAGGLRHRRRVVPGRLPRGCGQLGPHRPREVPRWTQARGRSRQGSRHGARHVVRGRARRGGNLSRARPSGVVRACPRGLVHEALLSPEPGRAGGPGLGRSRPWAAGSSGWASPGAGGTTTSSRYPFWKAVDPTLKIQFKYMEGLYRVLDTLMSDFPDWIVEGCSSGGRRIDIGTMRRAHTYWF